MARRLKVDMTGVEAFSKASEGRHVVKIQSIEEKTSQGGNDMLVCCFEVIRGEDKGARVYENYPLVDTALWKLKAMLQAVGMKANGKISLDLDKLEGKVLVIEVKHEEYNGQTRARIQEYRKLSAESDDAEDDEAEDFDDEDEAEDEKPGKKPSKKVQKGKTTVKKKKPVEDDEDESDEDFDDEDEDEEEEQPKKPAKKPAKKSPKKKAPEPEEDDEEDFDEDEEEDEEESKSVKKPAKKASKPANKAKKPEPEDEDDEEEDEEDWEEA